VWFLRKSIGSEMYIITDGYVYANTDLGRSLGSQTVNRVFATHLV